MQIRIPVVPNRHYQREVWEAMDQGFKRAFLVWNRRAGKDHFSLNYMLKRAIQETGIYYYVFPTYTQGKKIVWDDTRKMDMIPKEVIKNRNNTEMKLELVNSSIIQIVGSDRYDSLRGTDPRGIVMSEYAYQHPLAWEVLRPILAANNGWAIFNTTPQGDNHAKELWEYAEQSDRWFTSLKTVDDTQSISKEELAEEQRSMDKEMFLQEYYCSFSLGAYGAYFGEQIKWLKNNKRIREIGYDPALPVDTFWDIGINDQTAIFFCQKLGQEIRIIDYLEDVNRGFADYINEIEQKPYTYRKHYLPHDFNHKEFIIGETRLEFAKKRGFTNIEIVPRPKSLQELIDITRRLLPRCWFDEEKTKMGLRALSNYQREYDEVKKIFKNSPLHNWASHGASAFMYMASTYRLDPQIESIMLKRDEIIDFDEELDNAYNNSIPYWK
jgi:hypothetical protein